jgi:hypothetical protein
MTTFTPGPWHVHTNIGRKGETGVIADGAPCIIAIMGNQKEWPAETANNAQLIAAAPELLEALEFCYTWLENMRHEFRGKVPMSPHMPRPDMGLSDVAAAIAKAKGE